MHHDSEALSTTESRSGPVRATMPAEMPQTITFDLGLEFIERNKDADDWFLQLETFDP